MSRKSKYTGGFRPKKCRVEYLFPYVVFDDKKEVYFRIVSGFLRPLRLHQ